MRFEKYNVFRNFLTLHIIVLPFQLFVKNHNKIFFLLDTRHAVDVIIPYVYDIGLSLIKSRRYLEPIIINSVFVIFRVSHW